ncbi:conserved hypothetical protein [uncultured delta proteobacterium]|uniref:DUF2007 domain-containing protein n=1 Tax=uncultured delta proteobacterium TaxID=34034 RepID=A0A212KCZ3_9DELT|nr:conserved hypothetical protein [uncultured delta proteobacterium]
MEKQAVIASFDDLPLAYIAKGKLESAGIPCRLTNEYLVGINNLYANMVGGIDLIVPERDEAVARELLTGQLSRLELAPEDRALAPDLEEALFEPDCACPRCGSTDVKQFSLRRALMAVTYLFFGLPLASRKTFYTCGVCGHKWRDGQKDAKKDEP